MTLPVAEGPPFETNCPMCGHHVRVVSTDGGTSNYEPIEGGDEAPDHIRRAVLALKAGVELNDLGVYATAATAEALIAIAEILLSQEPA